MTSRRMEDGEAREFVLAGVVDGSEVALQILEADFASEELVAFLAELLMACVALQWPQRVSLPEVAAYFRGSRRFTDEGVDVSPMITEAVVRAAAGDARFIEGLSGERLVQHISVALRILVPNLRAGGTTATEIAAAAGRLSP